MSADSSKRVARRALRSIRREAGRAALGERMPEEKRASPEFLVSIGLGPKPELPEVDGDDGDPDEEIYGHATDDDPELPGRESKRRRR